MLRMVKYVCLALAATFTLVHAADPATQPTTAQAMAALRPSGDAGTDLVVTFYKALLQENPPTLEQEQSLFGDNISGLRERFIRAGLGTDKDPVVLLFFRSHKEWFVPKNMASLQDIQITSSWHVVQTLAAMTEVKKQGYGYVTVILNDHVGEHVVKPRSIVFCYGEGRLEAGGIDLDGFGGHLTQSEFLKVHFKGEMEEFGRYKDRTKPAK